MADQIKIATLRLWHGDREKGEEETGDGRGSFSTMNTFDDLPTMIVFTFSPTSDFAESLLAMSSKSSYYPKPISGNRLFVESTLVIPTIDSSGARSTFFFSFRKMSYKDPTTH